MARKNQFTFVCGIVRAVMGMGLFVLLTASQARAGRTVRVGIYNNPPLVSPDKKGGAQGIYPDILNSVARDQHWTLKYVPCEWVTCLDMLGAGDLDLMTAIAYSEERSRTYSFNREAVMSNWGRVYTYHGSGIESILDLDGRRVGIIENDIYSQELIRLAGEFGLDVKFIECPGYWDVLKDIQARRVDAGVTSRLFGDMNDAGYGLDRTPMVFRPINLHFAAPRGRSDLLDAIDKRLKPMKHNAGSIYYESIERWIGGESRRGIPRWLMWALAAAVGLLLLGSALLVLFRSQVMARTRQLSSANADLIQEVAVREQAQKDLRNSEQRYRDIFTALPTCMWEEDFSDARERLFALKEQYGAGLRAFFEANPQEMVSIAEHIRIIDVNPASMAMSGAASVQEFISNFKTLFCEETMPAFLDFLVGLAEGRTTGAEVETALQTFSGEMRDMQLAWAVATGHEQDLSRLWFSLVDITSRKKAERALRRSEEQYRLLSDTARDLIAMHDMTGRITYVNPAGLSMLGYTREQIETMNVVDLISRENLDQMRDRMNRRRDMDNTVFLYEIDARTRDGRSVPLEISSSLVLEDGAARGILLVGRDITERRATRAQLELYRRHLEDLVDERTRELQETREQLLAAEHLALLGRFAGNISHEIRNPLGVISNSAYFLNKLLAGSDQARVHKHLDIIQRKVLTCTGIIEGILRLTNMEKPAFAPLDAVTLLRDIMAGIEFPENIRADLRVPDEPVSITADKEQLRMAVSNLIRNGMQSMTSGGALTVAAKTGTMETKQILTVSVSDTGSGIPEEHLDKIFQPLFTTKSQGMGFGLSLAKMVAEAHGGAISAHTNDQGGALFILTIPLVPELT